MKGSQHVSVLVVGAGPAGLFLAAELQRRGISCQLIDAASGPLPWDRATVIHPRSLEVFESLGLVARFLEAGTKQRVIKMYSQGALLGALDLSESGSLYGFNIGLSEEVTESILTEYLHAAGGTVLRSSRLVGLTQHDGGVLAEIECDGQRRNVEADWVVGCDGAHSVARERSGIALEGHEIAKPWAVFDATIQGWTEGYELNVGYLDSIPLILTALPAARWRAYLRPSSAESDVVADATTTLHRYDPALSFVDVANPTRFHCHSKVANRFRSGRVLLAGDAAHLCSPAQGHGMNGGVQDAFNLAWKLALVCHGVADASLLDSYEAERRPAAQMVVQSGDASEEAAALTDPVQRESRDTTMHWTFTDPGARHNEAVAEAELNIDYSTSPIVFGDNNNIINAGQRLPNTIPVRMPGSNSRRLHELTHRAGHTLVLLGGAEADASELAETLGTLQQSTAGSPMVDAVVAVGAHDSAESLGCKAITLLAVRPDGYIGMRADRDHLSALRRYRALVTGLPPLSLQHA
ncbi:MAG TPA: FAD-dependent monooxygenase [Candidatus Nitrosotalea sp.]|nr:FAD-dependent monooxygenase [Candidatus Nitrosotalea sp.]